MSEFEIKDVIFNDPATIVLWADGTKTVVKCQEGDLYSEELGLAMCFAKKALGNKSNFNNVFHKWVPEEEGITPLDRVKRDAEAGVLAKLTEALLLRGAKKI